MTSVSSSWTSSQTRSRPRAAGLHRGHVPPPGRVGCGGLRSSPAQTASSPDCAPSSRSGCRTMSSTACCFVQTSHGKVDLLRAYNGYARRPPHADPRTGTPSRAVATGAPFWSYFQTKFDPALPGNRSKGLAKVDEVIQDALREVDDHDQDVTFRTLHDLMAATPDEFLPTDRPEHYISFKIDRARVRQMPSPRLKYEIYASPGHGRSTSAAGTSPAAASAGPTARTTDARSSTRHHADDEERPHRARRSQGRLLHQARQGHPPERRKRADEPTASSCMAFST